MRQTFEEIVDFLDASGLVRQEPLLVVGGGLVTDVAGYVCASYRRSTPFIRVPTTLIGLIDASVSIKVGLNHKKLKNRLGEFSSFPASASSSRRIVTSVTVDTSR
jgi:3-dehydroquinate synthetase